MKTWNIYLSGEIHNDWRGEIEDKAKAAGLPVAFSAPVTIHADSDDCGAVILGEEDNPFWRDKKGAQINAIRTRTLIENADIVVVRFGEKYRQWNAAFDAGIASALNTPLIVQHLAEHQHALKEIDAAALAVVETVDQIVDILRYVTLGELRRG
ncbi:MAG: YtoQ family protein [Maricaulaceae bacterium]|jgi:YtoQ family protein